MQGMFEGTDRLDKVAQRAVAVAGHNQGAVFFPHSERARHQPGRKIAVRADDGQLVVEKVIAHRPLKALSHAHSSP